ncbi:MAG: hypothetical protein HKL96_12835 [Phycisphaerales bacterium]|nr:hypothetical protein [Phycisphaerales bacterium]
MTEANSFKPRLHDADADFMRRALCYLESQLTEAQVQQLDAELRADASKVVLLARLSLLRSALLEELLQPSSINNPRRPDKSTDPITPTALEALLRLPLSELRSADMNEAMILQALQSAPERPSAPVINLSRRSKPRISAAVTRPRHLLHSPWAYAGIAAILVAVVLIWTGVMHRGAPDLQQFGPLTLTQSVNARWGGGQPIIKQNARLPAGKLTLESGLAEVMFTNGVRIIVQGPTTFDANSPRQVYLKSGRVVAAVPHTVRGFAVATPNGTVVDLGTEFGVAVRLHQPTIVSVLRGHVRAEITTPAGAVLASKVVAQNQAVKLLGTTQKIGRAGTSAMIVPTAPQPLAFVRPSQLAMAALPPGYRRWRAFSDQLRTDPSLRAYYTFNNRHTAPHELLNRAATTTGRYNGLLGAPGDNHSNPQWSRGQWSNKGSLAFNADRHTAVTLHVGTHFIPQHAMTVAVWLRPTDPGLTGHIINESINQWTRFDLVWLGSRCAEFPKSPMGFYFDWGGGAVITKTIAPSTPGWILLVVTARRGGTANFYINGRLMQRLPCTGPAHPHAATILIGRPEPMANQNECWDGRMDELAIFSRELSGAEIAAMYHAGRPGSGR